MNSNSISSKNPSIISSLKTDKGNNVLLKKQTYGKENRILNNSSGREVDARIFESDEVKIIDTGYSSSRRNRTRQSTKESQNTKFESQSSKHSKKLQNASSKLEFSYDPSQLTEKIHKNLERCKKVIGNPIDLDTKRSPKQEADHDLHTLSPVQSKIKNLFSFI